MVWILNAIAQTDFLYKFSWLSYNYLRHRIKECILLFWGGIQMYGRTPVTQTLKEKEKQFKLEEVPVIEVD